MSENKSEIPPVPGFSNRPELGSDDMIGEAMRREIDGES
jgi:hypothetical protein